MKLNIIQKNINKMIFLILIIFILSLFKDNIIFKNNLINFFNNNDIFKNNNKN
jgi:hypothetical protein